MTTRGLSKRVRALLEQALERPEEDRERFLDQACVDDKDLRERVARLLSFVPEASRNLGPITGWSEHDEVEAASSGSQQDDLPDTIGTYKVIACLGRGGMGTVLRVHDPALRRDMALKMIPWDASDAFLRRFEQESRILARLEHPGIVRVFAVGQDRDRHYFTMELVAGSNLAAELELAARATSAPDIAASRWLPGPASARHIARVVELISGVAEALDHAHRHGVLHRDIKPANILLDQATGRARVADFGVARDAAQTRLTDSGQPGTLDYMSPEQIEGRADLDARTDVFSLGVVLQEALSLRHPFGKDRIARVSRIARDDRETAQRANRSVPRDLALICETALAHRKGDRYESAAALADDLRRFLRHEAISIRPPSAVKRTARVVRRHPGRFAASIAIVLVAGTFVADLVAGQRHRRGLIESLQETLALRPWDDDADLLRLASTAEQVRAFRGDLADFSAADNQVLGLFLDQLHRHRQALYDQIEAHQVASKLVDQPDEAGNWHRSRVGALAKDLLILDPSDQAGLLRNPGISALSRPVLEIAAENALGESLSAAAWLAPVDCLSGLAGGYSAIDTTPCIVSNVTPGFWRVLVVYPDGEFQESDVWVSAEGQPTKIALRQRPLAPSVVDAALIQGGRVTFVADARCVLNGKEVDIPPFFIDRHEVTNREYRAFVEDVGGREPLGWAHGYSTEVDELPVTGISWFEMDAYARWAGKRLPSHAEWEFSARGPDWARYPWRSANSPQEVGAVLDGPVRDSRMKTSAEWMVYLAHSVPVHDRAGAATPDGLFHVLGNVSEALAGPFVEVLRVGQFHVNSQKRTVVGGSYLDQADMYDLLSIEWLDLHDNIRPMNMGFRCVRTAYNPVGDR